jgi:hypothetical protein
MHLAQRFYKTVNDMPAAKGRDVLDSSKELSIPLSNHVESQDLREIAAIFDTDLDVVEKGCKRVAMYIESPQQACKPQHFARFATNLFSNEEHVRCILPMIDAVEELGVLIESKPPTIAACCLAVLVTHSSYLVAAFL